MQSPGPWRKRYVPGSVFELRDADGHVLLKQVGGMLPVRDDQIILEAAAEMRESLGEVRVMLRTSLKDYADEPWAQRVIKLVDRVWEEG